MVWGGITQNFWPSTLSEGTTEGCGISEKHGSTALRDLSPQGVTQCDSDGESAVVIAVINQTASSSSQILLIYATRAYEQMRLGKRLFWLLQSNSITSAVMMHAPTDEGNPVWGIAATTTMPPSFIHIQIWLRWISSPNTTSQPGNKSSTTENTEIYLLINIFVVQGQ